MITIITSKKNRKLNKNKKMILTNTKLIVAIIFIYNQWETKLKSNKN